jgi:hypothetical protein
MAVVSSPVLLAAAISRDHGAMVKLQKTTRKDNRKKTAKKKPLKPRAFFEVGGVDGTRTRDPRRDRPVF